PTLDLVSISLKRSTQNLQLSTSSPADYANFEDEPGRRAAAKLLIRDEARRIAANVAKLLEVLRQSRTPSSVSEPSTTGATSGVTGSEAGKRCDGKLDKPTGCD